MGLYFIKVNLALGLLYMVYRLLFREDTFFRLRRLTLLGIILLAFLYPLPDIKNWVAQQPLLVEYVQAYSSVYQSNEAVSYTIEMQEAEVQPAGKAEATFSPSPAIDWRKIGTLFYLSGIFVLFFRCMAELLSIYRISGRSRKQEINGIPVYVSSEIEEPYSFFDRIFIQPEKYNPRTLSEILIHEATHVRELHSLDVVLGEIVTILCWFNPFAWLLKKEISINHEFIADQEVMDAGFNKKEYQYHLIGLKHPPMAAANLYNYFSVLPLKKRITMLNKKRMHRAGVVKYLALAPLAAALLIANNMDVMARIAPEPIEPATATVAIEVEAPIPPDDDKVYTQVDVMPEFPGGDAELLKYISTNLKYPVIAFENGIQGRVVVSFTVEKDGSISGAEVVRSIDPSLDQEALRVINTLPKWTPGKNEGKIVRVKYTVPIQFKMNRGPSEPVKKNTTKSTPVESKPLAKEHKGEKVYTSVFRMPVYPGGDPALMKFLADNIQYPKAAKDNGIQGRVVMTFIVEKDGTPTEFEVIRGIDPALDKEALRVAALMAKWTPGQEEGQPVHVRYTVPITFKL
ncbi:M56 family metallopeptidase [Parabacteroides sp. PF5-6]|uniref:M56 family metallopeptidase n=1 Tax=Parabacteroides sp. PF5-6 TaxID=1742403 RepID=UPI0024076327|nr:M56 family metallopeptidase [Parabacteroides sp. PF5-6]MDF9829600.1 TonB family protein [Parabacteroides sp. PF5-6]